MKNDNAASAAIRALRARKGAPSEADRPPVSVFTGKKIKPLPGQLDIFGRERQHPDEAA